MFRPAPSIASLILVPCLAACDRSEKQPEPEPQGQAEVSGATTDPVPADRFTTDHPEAAGSAEVRPVAPGAVARVVAPNVPNHEDRRIRMAIAELTPAETGGPVNIADEAMSADRAFQVLYRHLGRMNLPTESFYMKYSDEVGGYRYYMFFGVPRDGEGMYVHMRLFPDGRVELVD